MLIAVLYLSHFLADFILQTNKMVEEKDGSYKTSLFHALVHLGVALIVLFLSYLFTLNGSLFSGYNLIALGLVGISHFIIDKFGKPLIIKCCRNNEFFVFVIDQIIHLILIFLIVFLIVPGYDFGQIYYSIYIANRGRKVVFEILNCFTTLIILTSFTGHLISKLFKSLNNKQINDDKVEEISVTERTIDDKTEVITEKIKYPVEVNDYGKWIGYCERVIVFLFVVLNIYEGIAIIVALKTFARYQQLKQKSFVEKYLLGTIFSVMMAIIIGILYSSL